MTRDSGAGLARGFFQLLSNAHARFSPVTCFSPGSRNFPEELCYYAHILLVAIASHLSPDTGSGQPANHGQHRPPSPPRSRSPLPTTGVLVPAVAKGGNGDTSLLEWEAAHGGIVDLGLRVAGAPGVSFSALAAVLKLQLQYLQLVQRNKGTLAPSEVKRLLSPQSNLAGLRYALLSCIWRLCHCMLL